MGRWHHHVPRYRRQNAEGDHRPGSLHHQDQDHRSPPRGSTPCGSVAPSSPPSPPSSRCGSPSRSTTSAAPPSSTASASKPFDPAFILPDKPSISHTYQCACVLLYYCFNQILLL